jgi:hypothetical protein
MHPTVHYQLAQDRIADLRHQAQRDALARSVRRSRRSRRLHRRGAGGPVPRLLAAARRVLAKQGAPAAPATPATPSPRTAP